MVDKERIEHAVKEILYAIGEDPERDGLIETPKRVAKMYDEIYSGYFKNPIDEIKIFDKVEHGDWVMVRDIPVYSVCEHHIIPFFGKMQVAYIPRGEKVVGLSKILRVVDVVSKKLQLQEKLCSEVADVIEKTVKPLGIAVYMEAEHLCMTMRGIRKPGSKTVTLTTRGVFKTDEKLRNEIMSVFNR